MERRVLFVAAHPDDMEFLAGGTVAKMTDDGAQVTEVIVTNGERGTLELGRDELIARRQKEAREAASVLGLKDVSFLDYPDGMLSDFRFNEIRERLMGEIRRRKPQVLMTWDPFAPYENHQDHRITGMATMEAAAFANLPLYCPEQVKAPADLHIVTKTYYIAKHHQSPNHLEDITAQIDRKIEALLCHQTQMEFMIASIRQTLIAQGKPETSWRRVDPTNYRQLIDLAVRRHDSALGRQIGAEFAEQFRVSEADSLTAALEDLERG